MVLWCLYGLFGIWQATIGEYSLSHFIVQGAFLTEKSVSLDRKHLLTSVFKIPKMASLKIWSEIVVKRIPTCVLWILAPLFYALDKLTKCWYQDFYKVKSVLLFSSSFGKILYKVWEHSVLSTRVVNKIMETVKTWSWQFIKKGAVYLWHRIKKSW